MECLAGLGFRVVKIQMNISQDKSFLNPFQDHLYLHKKSRSSGGHPFPETPMSFFELDSYCSLLRIFVFIAAQITNLFTIGHVPTVLRIHTKALSRESSSHVGGNLNP